MPRAGRPSPRFDGPGLYYRAVSNPDQPRRPLTEKSRVWLTVFLVFSVHDGVAFLVAPGLDPTPSAYALAFRVLPSQLWGLWCIAAGGAAAFALWSPRWQQGRQVAGIAAMVGYGAVGIVFGLSIEALALDGVWSASLGATKWWCLALIASRVLLHPNMWAVDAGSDR